MNSHELMFQFDSALTSKCSFHFFRRFQYLCMRLRLVSPRGFFCPCPFRFILLHSGVEELFVSPYNVEASLELMPYSMCLLSPVR
jgi:hypothetical protein